MSIACIPDLHASEMICACSKAESVTTQVGCHMLESVSFSSHVAVHQMPASLPMLFVLTPKSKDVCTENRAAAECTHI